MAQNPHDQHAGVMAQVDWKLVLEFVKVFLSWPPIVGLAIIVGARYFRTELRKLINRVSSFKILGQELVTQQAKLEGEAPADGNPPVPDDGAMQQELQNRSRRRSRPYSMPNAPPRACGNTAISIISLQTAPRMCSTG